MAEWVFECIDGHTCGNPVRLVKTGRPDLVGKDMSEKRQDFLKSFDWIRTGLMFEPRGHDMMSGSFLYPSHNPNNDIAVLFIETSGCLPMCGHGAIGTVTFALEEGLIEPIKPGELRLETPAGLIKVDYQQTNDKVEWVRLMNVPSYLAEAGLKVDCPGLGELEVDVAYGGNFYAIIDPQGNFKGIQDYTASEIINFSRELRHRLNKLYPDRFIHPEDTTIRGVSHVEWTGDVLDQSSSGRNAVFYGDKAIDRSPCGTGTSARMAQLHAKGLLNLHESFIHESYIGSRFTGRIEEETKVGNYDAIIPSIQGWARRYGYNTILIDDEDPYAFGFQVI
ncbi:MAG: 4-hydroxyproline epimerase [Flavobacteriaceae bacterium]|nr:4-hydroxyproline epimerase [Bacteroidia bacterium]MBT8288748.1 4-hydroxyproline epimerase [Bacteroidia bacterium]NNF73681.1 4-hydroxyproline epimerase [Flavobacteriaceae bacterium]NNK71761.1 4-hydroxyproline epimerase [Flavobacteriaceae bacterium]